MNPLPRPPDGTVTDLLRPSFAVPVNYIVALGISWLASGIGGGDHGGTVHETGGRDAGAFPPLRVER
jgi:hypothetical protein